MAKVDKSIIEALLEVTTHEWCLEVLNGILETTLDIEKGVSRLDKILWSVRWAYIYGYTSALSDCEEAEKNIIQVNTL